MKVWLVGRQNIAYVVGRAFLRQEDAERYRELENASPEKGRPMSVESLEVEEGPPEEVCVHWMAADIVNGKVVRKMSETEWRNVCPSEEIPEAMVVGDQPWGGGHRIAVRGTTYRAVEQMLAKCAGPRLATSKEKV